MAHSDVYVSLPLYPEPNQSLYSDYSFGLGHHNGVVMKVAPLEVNTLFRHVRNEASGDLVTTSINEWEFYCPKELLTNDSRLEMTNDS